MITVMAMSKKRPVFSETAGALFARLRRDSPNNLRGSLSSMPKAAREAERLGIPNLSLNMIWRAENGQIKRPSADFVRAVAQLYGYNYEQLFEEITRLYFGVTAPDTSTSDDRKKRGEPRTTVVASASKDKRSHHGSPSPSISASSERTRALEAGLRNILAIAITLLGKAAAARFVDDAAVARGAERTSEETPGASARDRRPYAKSAGARR